MIAARIVPRAADEETLDEAIRRSVAQGLVPCVPANFRPDQEFRVTFIAPCCIPANWRRLVVKVKSPTLAELEIAS